MNRSGELVWQLQDIRLASWVGDIEHIRECYLNGDRSPDYLSELVSEEARQAVASSGRGPELAWEQVRSEQHRQVHWRYGIFATDIDPGLFWLELKGYPRKPGRPLIESIPWDDLEGSLSEIGDPERLDHRLVSAIGTTEHLMLHISLDNWGVILIRASGRGSDRCALMSWSTSRNGWMTQWSGWMMYSTDRASTIWLRFRSTWHWRQDFRRGPKSDDEAVAKPFYRRYSGACTLTRLVASTR